MTMFIGKMKMNLRKKFREIVDMNEKGFSTLELTIVVAIVGIMAAIALPRMGSVTPLDIYGAANQVKSDIRYAQELAMTKFVSTTIDFDAGGTSYIITGAGVDIESELPESSRVTFDDGDDSTRIFTFDSFGEPAEGGTLTISYGDSSANIIVESVTGKVTIE